MDGSACDRDFGGRRGCSDHHESAVRAPPVLSQGVETTQNSARVSGAECSEWFSILESNLTLHFAQFLHSNALVQASKAFPKLTAIPPESGFADSHPSMSFGSLISYHLVEILRRSPLPASRGGDSTPNSSRFPPSLR
jgi:hypothetical protein